MEWLALSLAFVATVYFAIHYPGFRRGLALTAGVTTVIVALVGSYVWNENRIAEKRREAASKLIRLDEIEIQNPLLQLGAYPSMRASVVNHSNYKLEELVIKIAVYECALGNAGTMSEPRGNSDPLDKLIAKHSERGPLGPPSQKDATTAAHPHAPVGTSGKEVSFDDLIPQFREGKAVDGLNAERRKPPCPIVGEQVVHAYSIDVPSRQKRALKETLNFRDLPELSEWSWNYSIEKTIAKIDGSNR